MNPSLRYTIRQEAVKSLWDKRSMLPEHSEEIVDDVLDVVEKHTGDGFRLKEEVSASESSFLGVPERWLDDPTWKCANGHISKRYLKSEALGQSVCLACRTPVELCDPNEQERSLG